MMEEVVNTWYCAVSVATVWTSPESTRSIDGASLGNPVRIVHWLEKLSYEPRLDLCDGNRIQTQLIYGEPVIVESIEDGWAKIVAVWQQTRKDERGYPGWVPLEQLRKAKPVDAVGYVKVVVGKAQVWTTDGTPSIIVPLNTILPYLYEEDERVQVCTPDGYAFMRTEDVERAPSIHLFKKSSPSNAVTKGLVFLDVPYLWGGMSPYGYDCSGFTFHLLKACGHSIPRDASDQAKGGVGITMEDPTCRVLLW